MITKLLITIEQQYKQHTIEKNLKLIKKVKFM